MDLYPIATDRQPRLLGVFAHPDDEVFCAGGTLARWAAMGGETMVISATRGEAGQIQDAAAATRRTLGSVRERELLAACARLGVGRVECLDYRDGTLAEVDMVTLAGEVAARIRAFAPDVVITFGPDGGYGHPDHIAISAATVRACQQIAHTEGHAPRVYFSAFPRHHGLLCQQLAQWLEQQGSSFRGSDTFTRALALLADEATMLGYADDSVEVRWFPAGIAILEQGEAGNDLYLIVSGHADVIEEDSRGGRRVRRHLGPGEFFGHEALIRRQPHRA
jgi:LmbE family N-acetylglucosaminyl deacetylase